MGLFSPEEIQHLRGEGVPPGLTEHGLAAFRYLESFSMNTAVASRLCNTSTGNCGAELGDV